MIMKNGPWKIEYKHIVGAIVAVLAIAVGVRFWNVYKAHDINRDLNRYDKAYRMMLVLATEEERLGFYTKYLLPILEKYPNVMGSIDPDVLGQHVPLLVVLPSPWNKHVGILYGDHNPHDANRRAVVVKFGRKSFFDWQGRMLANPEINVSFTCMPKERLKESIVQTITSSKTHLALKPDTTNGD